jgi:hypothetical protein
MVAGAVIGGVWDTLVTPCPVPTDDVSQFDVWGFWEDDNGRTLYAGFFNAQVTDGSNPSAPGKYAGRIVTEWFSEQHDYCFERFRGPYFLHLSPHGKDAVLNADNSYLDIMGADRDWIDYYVAHAQDNCWFEAKQGTAINSCTPGGSWAFYEPGGHLLVIGVKRSPPTYGVQRENSYSQSVWPWPY